MSNPSSRISSIASDDDDESDIPGLKLEAQVHIRKCYIHLLLAVERPVPLEVVKQELAELEQLQREQIDRSSPLWAEVASIIREYRAKVNIETRHDLPMSIKNMVRNNTPISSPSPQPPSNENLVKPTENPRPSLPRIGALPPPNSTRNEIRRYLSARFDQLIDFKNADDWRAMKCLIQLVAIASKLLSSLNDEDLHVEVIHWAVRCVPAARMDAYWNHHRHNPRSLAELLHYLKQQLFQHNERIRNQWRATAGNTRAGPNQCNYCKSAGHHSTRCPDIEELLCVNCFEFGHTNKRCSNLPLLAPPMRRDRRNLYHNNKYNTNESMDDPLEGVV